ncbi:MAG: MBL fold metallo-hydrolase [Polaromonas sp.]|uniref:MBL fold metallo-hydrolase n=1 Tax=Polaromonas sp. TaxID=1869339 RepID=UPI001851B0F1|nr:MBL fold metallo-hydrolase [Polaromonas sp.]MBA3592627.1 MBL fold metallo-hydrolase [Polaromonas sp.]
MTETKLPPGVLVFERGWLSSNNILFLGADSSALVDSGYGTHAAQTVALVETGLKGRRLDCLLNTHLHSDHCGGNAALQAAYPDLQTWIPPGQEHFVSAWDPVALSYEPTGQFCPRFGFTDLLKPGSEVRLADISWEIHAAPGHDPHSVILFEPASRTLISADALWESGFGVVFPELDGEDAFGEVAATLDLVERLNPRVIIPGHGPIFGYRSEVLAFARRRLASFVANPGRHANHAAKVLLKFKLLERQKLKFSDFSAWARRTSHFEHMRKSFFPSTTFESWIEQLTEELVRSAAARRDGDLIFNN